MTATETQTAVYHARIQFSGVGEYPAHPSGVAVPQHLEGGIPRDIPFTRWMPSFIGIDQANPPAVSRGLDHDVHVSILLAPADTVRRVRMER
ncbi:hypothetical protein GCM10027267_05170 [Paramicrobacterium agarici]